MTNDQIQEILKAHKMWLDSDGQKGKNANLQGEDLRRVNLRYADLREACLIDADLRGAYLYSVNLCGACLVGADLRGANLQRSNVCSADLHCADLREASLLFTDLHGANLTFAKLSGANFNAANLCEVDFYGAIDIPCIPMACPSDGSFIGWKKAHDMIVKLQIPEDAKRSSATGRKCRCDKAVVLAIENLNGSPVFCRNAPGLEYAHTGVLYNIDTGDAIAVRSNYDSDFIYKIGETVSVDNFDMDRFHECAPGIHFFIDRQEAVDY